MSDNRDNPGNRTSKWYGYYLLALIPCLCIGFLAVIHLKSVRDDLRVIDHILTIQVEYNNNLDQTLTSMRHDSRLDLYYATGLACAGLVGMGVIVIFVLVSERAHRRTRAAKARAESLVKEVRSTEMRLNLAMRVSNQGLWELKLVDGSTYYDDNWYTMLGYEPGEMPMHTNTWESLCHPDDLPVALRKLNEYTEGRADNYRHDLRIRMKNGLWKWVHDTGEIIERDDQGNPTRIIGVQIDIDYMKRNELKLIESETRYKLAVNGSRDGLWDWDLITGRVYYAPQWKHLLGLTEDDLVTDSPDEWISRIEHHDVDLFMRKFNEHLGNNKDVFEVETRMIHKSGEQVWMLCRGTVIRDDHGRAVRVAGSLADITDIKHAQEQLQHLAQHDRLTGLPNRELFLHELQQTIDRAKDKTDDHYAVLFFDFDRFKLINDSLGHDVGDALLVDIANLFRQQTHRKDVASRFGGDEFVLLLRNLENENQAEHAASRLLNVFTYPHILCGHEIYSTASIGVVKGSGQYTKAEDMLRDADAAMYRAKAAGRGRYILFDQNMYEQNLQRVVLEHDLRDAVDQDQVRLVYQPIVDLDTGQVNGFEALARWEHPTLGTLLPIKFIPIAEDIGLILPIGEHILRAACRQATQWESTVTDRTPPYINVNLSLRQLAHPSMIDTIRHVISDTGIDPSQLQVEITESIIVDKRYDLNARLKAIRELGIKIVMDDFGTGQSSLNILNQLPVDGLKIDHSFVHSLSTNRALAAVMQSIIMLAKNLDMTTIAEGIENTDQLVALQALGCEYAQGYYFNPPLTAEKATDLLLGRDAQPAVG